ncbi:MAG: hypothetical protein LKM39_07850 [Chiayiivirga sp.]|jgi:poly(3-hydroxybutyrate) depolymerase|nr:hypothetical protein [Chiayiivirga sp.]
MAPKPPVLVVAPLSGHHSTLLRDTVRTLLQDHKVYITDWTDARMVPMSEGRLPPRRLRGLRAGVHPPHRPDNLHVISVCQPTVPVLAAVSLMASAAKARAASMTMMGGPIDARSPTAVNNLAMNKATSWFERQRDLPRAAELPGRRAAASTPASCSTPASSR